MFVEIGVNQSKLVSELVPSNMTFVKIQKDLSWIDRIMVLKKNAQKSI